jgi:hypothetical protein
MRMSSITIGLVKALRKVLHLIHSGRSRLCCGCISPSSQFPIATNPTGGQMSHIRSRARQLPSTVDFTAVLAATLLSSRFSSTLQISVTPSTQAVVDRASIIQRSPFAQGLLDVAVPPNRRPTVLGLHRSKSTDALTLGPFPFFCFVPYEDSMMI